MFGVNECGQLTSCRARFAGIDAKLCWGKVSPGYLTEQEADNINNKNKNTEV